MGERFTATLQYRVAASVGLAAALVLGLLAWGNLWFQERELTQSVSAAAIRLADTAYAGLAKPMASGSREAIAEQMEQLARNGEAVEIYLLDAGLTAKVASVPRATGRRLGEHIADAALLSAVDRALGAARERREDSRHVLHEKLGDRSGISVLRPIHNHESCHRCHGAAASVLGALLVRQSVDEVAQRLRGPRRLSLIGGALGALLLFLLVLVQLRVLVLRPLADLSASAEALAGGDLTVEVRVPRRSAHDEMGRLARGLSTLSGRLRGILGDLQASTRQLDEKSSLALENADRQTSMASEQSAATQQTSAAVAEIAQTSQLNAQQADQVLRVAARSDELALAGRQAVEDAVQALERLAAQVQSIASSITGLAGRSSRIGEIVGVVEEVSERSNLLALNAALEAAQAGEAGRGFGVVAHELKALAAQSGSAAHEVRQVLAEVLGGTEAAVKDTEQGSRLAREAVALAEGAGQSIAGLAEAIRDSSKAARQIAGHARQQTTGVAQIAAAMHQLNEASAETVDGARQVQEIAASLDGVSKRLGELVAPFKV